MAGRIASHNRGGATTSPLDGKCLTVSLVYKAIIKSGDQKSEYIGLASTTFNPIYNNHISSFKNSKQESSTGLSKHVWSLKRDNKLFEIKTQHSFIIHHKKILLDLIQLISATKFSKSQ